MKAIDLFAGWGGFTLGAEMAGVDVVWAANHWPLAVEVHRTNHPRVRHECQDLRQANWSSLPAYDMLLASPACQGHSSAAQAVRKRDVDTAIRHDALRATAWAVVDCAEVTRPRAVIVENVPIFARWELFDIWTAALTRLGYHVTTQLITASFCGVPQRRTRIVIVGHQKRPVRVNDLATPEPAFEPCIDRDAEGWRPIAGAGDKGTRQRLTVASHRLRRCLVQQTTDHRGIPLWEPIRTITTKHQWCLVDGDRYRYLTARELARGMSFPDSYRWPGDLPVADVVKGIGNAIPPLMAKTVVEQVCQ